MSHITEVKTLIKDAQAIEDAAKKLDCKLDTNAQPRYYGSAYGGRESKSCDYVLRLPGKYDLGLKKNAGGTYDFVADNELFSGSFGRDDASRRFLGEDASRFRQEYAASVAMRAARRKNVSVFRSQREDGAVVITLRG